MKRLIQIALLASLAHSMFAQTVPAPQINLSGNVGGIGFPILNSGPINFTSDADMTLTVSSTNTSAVSAKITSMGNLTATRTIRYPAGRFRVAFENATMGGQAINICGPSGSCAAIPNDSAHFYDTWNDGTNVVETAIYSASSTTLTGDVTGTGTGTIATTIANKNISINSTTCTLGSSCTVSTGVSQIIAGSNISISGGTGVVTISATGAASPGPHITTTTSTNTTINLSTSPGYTVYTGTLITSGTISFALPSVSAGQEQCVATVLGGVAGTTNLQVSAFGSQVIQYASQSSTSGGYASSASNSSACFIGIDSVQWLLVTNDQIAWTLH